MTSQPRLQLPSETVAAGTRVLATAPKKSTVREYAEAIALALFLAFFIRSFILQAFKIPSESMIPTLQVGDYLLINKLRYGLRLPIVGSWLVRYDDPAPGDVVVFAHPAERTKDFIKRVIAVEGEMVEIRDKRVVINGVERDWPHTYFADGRGAVRELTPRDNFGPVAVPPGRLFVLGDNRDRSYDSRFWGFVDVDDVKGKAMLIYWSLDGRERWVRWERMGDLIH